MIGNKEEEKFETHLNIVLTIPCSIFGICFKLFLKPSFTIKLIIPINNIFDKWCVLVISV